MAGISILGSCGFNIAMQFPKNEILICVSLVILGGAGMACLPLMNELIVETTYPAGEATSTGIGVWLSAPLSGVLVALSSLISYSDENDYTESVCREGELQDLSWFFSIMNSIMIAYYLFFVYFYRKFDNFLIYFWKIIRPYFWFEKNLEIDRNRSCPYLRKEAALRKTVHQWKTWTKMFLMTLVKLLNHWLYNIIVFK